MQATRFEFRFRLWISVAIYFLGFWAPWARYGGSAGADTTAWLELSGELSRWLPLQTASVTVTSVAILLAVMGTSLRLWGTAYAGSSNASATATSGTRGKQLYLGSLLFLVAISILMPVWGAVFAIVAGFVQMLRLMLREESATTAQKADLSRTFDVRDSAAHPQWLQAVIAEIFYIAMTGCLTVLAWRYNANLLIQALLICFGLSLVARAFVVKTA